MKESSKERKLQKASIHTIPKTIERYNLEIDQAMEDSKNGRMIKATNLHAKILKYY